MVPDRSQYPTAEINDPRHRTDNRYQHRRMPSGASGAPTPKRWIMQRFLDSEVAAAVNIFPDGWETQETSVSLVLRRPCCLHYRPRPRCTCTSDEDIAIAAEPCPRDPRSERVSTEFFSMASISPANWDHQSGLYRKVSWSSDSVARSRPYLLQQC